MTTEQKIQTKTYVRKPLYVEAIQITHDNFVDVAQWCQGEIRDNDQEDLIDPTSEPSVTLAENCHIRIRVHNPKNMRQTKGFVGDWVLYTERGYKVYTAKAFKASFDPVGNKS